MSVKTRAGLMPVDTEIPYSITTEDAREFLQIKFDAVVKALRDNGVEQDDVSIMLFTSKVSEKFYPFTLICPISVLGRKKTKKNEADIFNPSQVEKTAKIIKPLWDVINPFIYNQDDEYWFKDRNTQRELRYGIGTANMLTANRLPHVRRLNKGRDEYVTVLLDPLRVFHNMLEDVNSSANNNFSIFINKIESIRETNYKYEVVRANKRKNKKKNKDFSYEDTLNREINRQFIRR